MRRHLPFALTLVAVGACSFPDATFSDGGSAPDDSGGVDRSASSSSGGADASSSSSGSDASGDRSTSGDAPADVIGDVSSSSSSGGDGSVNCDQDNDGYLAMDPPCNGTDCCDTDKNAHPPAHPGQPPFYAMPDKCGSYDYDCDTNADPEYGNTLMCTGIPATGCITHCSGVPSCMSGFLGGDPGCGMTATFGDCQSNMTGLACVPTSTGMQTQECN